MIMNLLPAFHILNKFSIVLCLWISAQYFEFILAVKNSTIPTILGEVT